METDVDCKKMEEGIMVTFEGIMNMANDNDTIIYINDRDLELPQNSSSERGEILKSMASNSCLFDLYKIERSWEVEQNVQE